MTARTAKWMMVVATMGLALQLAPRARADEGPSALQAPQEVPSFELEQPQLRVTAARDASVGAAFADFGLRAAEGALVTGCAAVGILGAVLGAIEGEAGGSPALGFAFMGAAALVGLGIVAVTPAISALLLSHIGDSSRFHHPLGPLMLTSYVSHLLVDAVTVGLLAAGAGLGSLVAYVVGSAMGSTAMGWVHDRTKVAVETAAAAWDLPVASGPAIPTSQTQGMTVRF
jgi:hypothetical protein